MDSLRRLEEIFGHFPGIGPRQARRFVYYILSKSPSFTRELAQLIEDVKRSTSECDSCHRLFMLKDIPNKICSICSDTSRDQSTLMIVARDSDYETVEKSSVYKGLYFILGGTVPILDQEPDKRIRLQILLEHVSKMNALKEIILSLNATPDGEHTADIAKEALLNIFKNGEIKITLLGRGISTGAELEYVDVDTIKNALKNRG
jgi:recombination protein RecR